jgi:hypothetical protein
MKLTAQHIYDATIALTQIINGKRAMPLKGKFAIARLHMKLEPEFLVIARQRDALVRSYGAESVPPEAIEDFNAKWGEISKTEIEVDVSPIPFAILDLGDEVDGGIEAGELWALGVLVKE